MQRNPKNPTEYTEKPKERSNEKLELLLKWLIQFHCSTRQILLKRMKLATHSHHTYFQKLEKQGILQKIRVYSINSRHIYMLTNLGKQIAIEKTGDISNYSTDKNKLNHSGLRHNLAIQNSVIKYMSEYENFMAEKYLTNLKFSDKKKPDACLILGDTKTMLEVELTPKSDKRIFIALNAHLNSLIENYYQKVIYVFPTNTLKNYYVERFNQKSWPIYEKNEKGLWIAKNEKFHTEIHIKFKENLIFKYDKSLLEGM